MSKYVVYCNEWTKEDNGNHYETFEIEARAGNEVTATGDLIIYTKDNEDNTILHTMFARGEWSRLEYIDEDVKPSAETIEHVAGTVLDAIRRNAPGNFNLDTPNRTEGGAGA